MSISVYTESSLDLDSMNSPDVDVIGKHNKLIFSRFVTYEMERFLNVHDNDALTNGMKTND